MIAVPLVSRPLVLTTLGAQGPTSIKVYELLRHVPGPDDVEEARKGETTKLQNIHWGHSAAICGKAIRESA